MIALIEGSADRTSAAHLDAGPVGQARVEDRHIGLERRNASDRCGSGAGLAHDLDLGVGLQELAQPHADELVVIEQEHADRSQRISSGKRQAS